MNWIWKSSSGTSDWLIINIVRMKFLNEVCYFCFQLIYLARTSFHCSINYSGWSANLLTPQQLRMVSSFPPPSWNPQLRNLQREIHLHPIIGGILLRLSHCLHLEIAMLLWWAKTILHYSYIQSRTIVGNLASCFIDSVSYFLILRSFVYHLFKMFNLSIWNVQ